MISHWDFSEYHTGAQHLSRQQDTGPMIFVLGIVQLYQVSSCLKVQHQKVKAGITFQKEISAIMGFQSEGTTDLWTLDPEHNTEIHHSSLSYRRPFRKAPSLSEILQLAPCARFEGGKWGCFVYKRKSGETSTQNESLRCIRHVQHIWNIHTESQRFIVSYLFSSVYTA